MKHLITAIAIITMFVSLSAGTSPAADYTTVIEQDFHDTKLFPEGRLPGTIKATAAGGRWVGFDGTNFSITRTGAGNETAALKVTRVEPARLAVHSDAQLPNDREMVARLRVHVGPTDTTSAAILFRNARQDKTVAAIRFDTDNIIAALANDKSHFGLRSVPESWQDIELHFAPGAEQIQLVRVQPDGTRITNGIPFDHNLPVDTIEFVTSPSSKPDQENSLLVSHVSLAYANRSSLVGRENILLSAYDAEGYIIGTSGDRRVAARLNDGDVTGISTEMLAELPATLLFELPRPVLVSTVRLFTGNAEYAANPSGEVAAKAFMVEGLSAASGQWRELASATDQPGFTASGATGNDDFYFSADFDPLEVSQLRITLRDSNDTGKRAGAAPDGKAVIVREVELYTRDIVQSGRKQLGNVLQAEFELPVYRDQPAATMQAILEGTDPIEVEVSVRERHTGHVPEEPRRLTLQPGNSTIDFTIADWETGEYRAQLRASGSDAPVGGSFGRLLRINRVPAAMPPSEPQDLTNGKLFFPDDWYLADHEQLEFKVIPSETHRVGRKLLKPDQLIQLGNGIGFLPDGKLAVTFAAMNREWKRESVEHYYATADVENLDQWEIHTGKPADIDSTPTALQQGQKASGGSDGIGYSFGDNENFRFYDAATDGPVPLNEIRVQYVGYTKVDWGVVQPTPQSTWILWRKGNEWVLLQDKPFLVDNITADEFEQPTNSNDNFAGQWLAEDGKTFYYVRGRLLKRYAPFVARYDNLWQVARILTVFSTQDGVNWNQHYFALPEVTDGPTAQHYGASIYSIPQGKGLMLSYTLPYSAYTQQMHVELYYSWDGIEWKRVPGHVAWIPPGQPGDWNFGHTTHHNNIIERDGKVYHLIGWAAEIPHFGGDFLYSSEETNKLDGPYLEKRYGQRDLTKWPFFPHYGSWEKLADESRTQGVTPGVSVHRVDGWFALSAGSTPGTATTRPLTASGTMAANFRIAAGGFIDLTLTDLNGQPIEGYAHRLTQGDEINQVIFEKLPTVPFRVKLELKDAELFTLAFPG